MVANCGAFVRSILAASALSLAALQVASAHSPALDARFASGAFLEAAGLAEAEATADDYAFAARAILAHCFIGDGEPDPALLDRARKNAEAALAMAPSHSEGRLQLAIALSLKSRYMDTMAAMNAGYGETGKKLATEVLNAEPANYYAHGFLAVWHVEVRRRGGMVGAGIMGASLDAARDHYQTAIRLAPDDVGLHWQYARALAAFDARKYRVEIAEVLARAASANAGDRIEQVMQARAVRLSEAMAQGHKAAQKLAQDLL